MFRIDTTNKPRGMLVRRTEPAHCVRVWKHSPEDIALQLWTGNRYVMVALLPEEARDIADALRTAACQVETKESTDAV